MSKAKLELALKAEKASEMAVKIQIEVENK